MYEMAFEVVKIGTRQPDWLNSRGGNRENSGFFTGALQFFIHQR